MVGIKHESMRKGQTSHKKEHNTRMCFPLKPVFTRDKGGLPNFIDEPFVALDPEAFIQLKELMKELCASGGSVLFSSHILDVVEKTCNKIAIIRNGELIRSGETKEILGNRDLENVFMELNGK